MDITGILNQLVSHAEQLGVFETVNQHEPKAKPATGLTCAIWADEITAVAAASGLSASSARIVFNTRIYTPMLQQPYDAIDPTVMAAVDVLITAYSGAFTLAGEVRDIDLLGEHGVALSAKAGYLNQDGTLYRVMTLTLPMIINDAWGQVA